MQYQLGVTQGAKCIAISSRLNCSLSSASAKSAEACTSVCIIAILLNRGRLCPVGVELYQLET